VNFSCSQALKLVLSWCRLSLVLPFVGVDFPGFEILEVRDALKLDLSWCRLSRL
jgi:hypothetical protein